MDRRSRGRNAAGGSWGRPVNIRVAREAGGIGDVVRMIPALRGLREKYPQARLWVFAPAAYRPLLAGWYDEFRATPHHGRRPRDAPLDERRWPYLNVGVKFDLSISLYCPAFRHEHQQRGNVWLDRIDLMCMAADVRPSSKLPRINLAPPDVLAAKRCLRSIPQSAIRNPKSKLIALQPFSTDPARNWPVANFAKLADALERAGHRAIILDGCKGRTSCFRQHRVLEKPLGFVAALLRECDLLVGPDSGLGHLAAAVGTPTVGLFASQSPGVMYRHYPKHTYVYPPWDGREHCRWPCFWNRPAPCARNALLRAGKTCPMLARIPVDAVYAAVQARLEADESRPSLALPMKEMSAEARQSLGSVEPVEKTPIPHPDFALDQLALTRSTDDLAPILREAYRVLKPGGCFHIAKPDTPEALRALAANGFAIEQNSSAPRTLACRKLGTWPRWHPRRNR